MNAGRGFIPNHVPFPYETCFSSVERAGSRISKTQIEDEDEDETDYFAGRYNPAVKVFRRKTLSAAQA